MRALSAMLIMTLSVPCHATEYELHFWPGAKAENDKRIVSRADGPCGEVVSARVNKMPRHSKTTSLVPERVFELDAKSKVVRTWYIPVDSIPIAVEGNFLHISFFDSKYSVKPDGVLNKSLLSSTLKEPTAATCQLPKAFSDSGYANCWLFEDVRSGGKRVLAFEGVCT